MSLFGIISSDEKLLRVAPITEKRETERNMRMAIQRVKRKGPSAAAFAQQQAFDRAVAKLVHDIPVSAEISEWFRNEKLIPQRKRGWRKTWRNPVVLSIVLALLVIAGVAIFVVVERMSDFPGSKSARKLLTVASSMRGVQLDPVEAEAGSLSDFFFMKYRLEHFDVPPEFAEMRTSAVRVFDDDAGARVAQITVANKRLQFFLFPAERSPKTAQPVEFSGWRFVEQDGWAGAVRVSEGVCFMATLRGTKNDLTPYLVKSPASAAPTASPR